MPRIRNNGGRYRRQAEVGADPAGRELSQRQKTREKFPGVFIVDFPVHSFSSL